MTFWAPLSDAVEALRALKALIVETVREIGSLEDARDLRHVRGALREFYFPPDGIRGVLVRIVENDATTDLEELGRRFRESDNAVAAAKSRLLSYRDRLGETSLKALEAVLLLQDGKFGLRQDIERMFSTVPAGASDEEEVRAAAKALVVEIDEFNQALMKLHDVLDLNGSPLS
jgi:hypothetical protein